MTPGSLFAALMWLALTVGFGVYVANFGNYNATYGSLGTVVVTLTWLYLSSYILLFGAELNAELEHQTATDTTTADAPLGARGAWVADHVADDGIPDASPGGLTAAKPSGVGDVVASRGAVLAAQMIGLPKVGWVPSAAATLGLALLRRGRGVSGVAVIGVTAATMWALRERPAAHPREPDPPQSPVSDR